MTAAVILAGGQSRRMGQDKALLSLEGRSLLARTCALTQALHLPTALVTPWGDRYREQIPATVQLIADPGQGPLVALRQAWTALSDDWLLLLACDLPRLTAAALQAPLAALPTRDPALAWVPYRGDRWEPLCGFYHRASVPSLDAYLAQGGRSFQGWLTILPAVPLDLADPQVLFNCNTPEDWHTVASP
jgi:molybdopterin-guanine dinucleotide biosynthesis protein A